MEIESISGRVESFLKDLSEEYYLTASGQKDESDLTSIYDAYEDLADVSIIDELRRETGDAADDRRRSYLLEFMFSLFQGYRTRDLDDRLLTLESTSSIEVDGERISYRLAPIELRNEPDRERRKSIQDEIHAIVMRDNPIRVEAFERVHEISADFGYDCYSDFIAAQSGIDLSELRVLCEEFLRSTEDIYSDAAAWAFRKKLGINLDEAATYDTAYLFRMTEFDEYFPADEIFERVKRFISGMNLDIEAGGNIKFDTEKRPSKSPRAFCSPISVPDRVMLVIMPHGGLSDYESFLHELGHAMHYGHADRNLPMEHRHLGDNSVTEGYAMLFDHLLLNAKWLRKLAGMHAPDDYLVLANLYELFMLRRYCAKLIYELELHDDSMLENMPDAYSSILKEVTKVDTKSVNYLNDVDPELYCARYLRAWMLQGLLNEHLIEDCGDDWFLNPEAGEKLLSLWCLGQKLKAEEIAEIISTRGLTFQPLISSIETALG